jgi:molybdopterin molybdotransferase
VPTYKGETVIMAAKSMLTPVADALAKVLDGADALPEEMVALDDAYHRVLARDVAALRTQPPDAMSAMDGYAVRVQDASTIPVKLRVIGEVAAGRPFGKEIGKGEAVRIFTGGVVPKGADAVIVQEDTERQDDDAVIIKEAARPGRHIRAAGIDFRTGDVLLRTGTRLTERDLALAAAMNHPELPVRRRPKVAFLATGDELVTPGTEPAPGQIVHSNGYALRALARQEGAEVIDLGVARDTMESTTAAIRRARELGADILVTTGGASVGDHDVVKRALEAEGVDIAFWRIALRPGKPMMHGRLGAMRVIGVPGNPASSYICSFLFAVPLIRALSGRADIHQIPEHAILGSDVAENDHRQDYLRARMTLSDGGPPVVTPVSQQDSSLLGNLSAAKALVLRPPHAPAATAGTPCIIFRLPS